MSRVFAKKDSLIFFIQELHCTQRFRLLIQYILYLQIFIINFNDMSIFNEFQYRVIMNQSY